MLQFEYIEIGPSNPGTKYVLMLRDDHSNYCWFFAFPDTSAENTPTAIIDWCAAFRVPKGLMSDGPTHFKNETIRRTSGGLNIPHHFTTTYCPWVGKELIRIFRSVVSE